MKNEQTESLCERALTGLKETKQNVLFCLIYFIELLKVIKQEWSFEGKINTSKKQQPLK